MTGELAALKGDASYCLTSPEYAALEHRVEDAHAAVEVALLEAELAELEREFMGSRTTVPDGILEDPPSSAFHEIGLSIHHPHPLAIEEAIRSGLFDAKLTTAMLVLARELKAHNLFLGEATSLEPHMDRAFAARLGRRSSREEFSRLLRRYAQAVRLVELSEESILAGCEEVLEGLRRTPTR